MSLRQATCFYCGLIRDCSEEHVPPKGLFPKRLEPLVPTIDACEQCNNSWSRFDAYFMDALYWFRGAWSVGSPLLQELTALVGARFAKRRANGVNETLVHIGPTAQVPIHDRLVAQLPSGQFLALDLHKLRWVACRCISTMFMLENSFHHHSKWFRVSTTLLYEPDDELRAAMALATMQRGAFVDGAFQYAFARDPHDPRNTQWVLSFFECVYFLGRTCWSSPHPSAEPQYLVVPNYILSGDRGGVEEQSWTPAVCRGSTLDRSRWRRPYIAPISIPDQGADLGMAEPSSP